MRALAAAGGADQGHGLAAPGGKVDVSERIALRIRIAEADVPELHLAPAIAVLAVAGAIS